MNFFRKLFLIREIFSKEGVLHFQRWRLLSTRWGSLFVHYIARSDEDKHMHDHPWDFWSLILSGGYYETSQRSPWSIAPARIADYMDGIAKIVDGRLITKCAPGYLVMREARDFHQITLIKPTWTLVWVGPRIHEPWGYLTEEGWMNHVEYRNKKQQGHWEG
jgi:hypothetical protein